MYSLRIENEQGEIRRIDVSKDTYSIGRQGDNDLVLPDINVSRRHAFLELRPEGLVLVDNASKYGIRMNSSQNPREVVLHGGDTFLLGDYRIELIPSEAEAMPAASATIRMAAVAVPPAAADPVPAAAPVAETLLKEAVGVPYTVAVSEDESLKVLLEMTRRRQGPATSADPDDYDPFKAEIPTEEERRSNMTRAIVIALMFAATAVIGWLLWSYWVNSDTSVSSLDLPQRMASLGRMASTRLLS